MQTSVEANRPPPGGIRERPLPPAGAVPPDAVLCVADGPPTDLAETAALILAPSELEFFCAMTAIERRKVEWFLGRAAAKEAVRLHLHRNHRLQVAARDITIVPDPQGKPHAAMAAPVRVAISIAHSGGIAAAIAWGAAHGPAGLDLEFPRKLSDDLIRETFGATELELAGGRSGALKLWCLKEAAAKVTGIGTRRLLRDLTVTRLDPAGGAELRDDDRHYAALLLPERDGCLAIAREIPAGHSSE